MHMKSVPPEKRIILPLDLPTLDEALRLTDLLKGHVGVFKIGLELFVASGPAAVAAVKGTAPGAGIFLDMKFHDIPATVKGAMGSAASLGAEFVTVHCDEGSALLKAAVEAAGKTKVLGVTVLTSLSVEGFKEAGIDPRFKDAEELVLHRARVAQEAGCAGVVCSGQEARAVREELGPDFLVVTPGIRSPEDDAGDQLRTSTPYEAIVNGADYIVVGRPIRNAKDPVGAASKIASEIDRALKERV
jgi:orotidine-5'-phosphate decarboxylase